MTIQIEIPEPLATKVEDAAKSRATSPEHYVLAAVSKTLAEEASLPPVGKEDAGDHPLLGLLADEPELADFIAESAKRNRQTLPLRAPRG